MPGAYDEHQIDFVIGPDSTDIGEDLPVDAPPNRRLRAGLIALGVAVLGGSAIARVTASSDGLPTAHASPSESSSASSSEAVFPEVISPTAGVFPHSTTYAKTCPLDERSRSLCTNANPLPADVLAALRAHFPGARVHSSREEELRDIGFGSGMLYYRELHAQVGRTVIDITVHPIIDYDRASIALSSTSITVQSLSPGDTVRVRVTSSHQRLPVLSTVYELASDRRLVVDG